MKKVNHLFTTRIRRHLLSVLVHAENENTARDNARREFFKKDLKLVSGTFRIEVKELSPGFFLCEVFDFYFIESLHFGEYFFHLFCKFKATISFYVGIVPEIVIVT